ncbi:hypothetical protein ABT390_30850 [Streptomyces aurantiacus]|uniref:Cupin 2 conserved barrel domain-containing protein n=1 Tax=Streptomyces aurantiacus JA 4570 TaxID=1286094 RepID=S3ZND5_9ACTN|nr:hypothetical protein [Streptomyces aurantiacus]EPH44688.1 hypothetical protein STRAU_2246 [Streptomyces aurantiacus JA 4570]
MGNASSSAPALTSTVVAKEFDRWSPPLRQEFIDNVHNGCLGQSLLNETDSVRVWETTLQPEERIPVHRHVLDYTWIALTNGRARQHNSDGSTREISYVRGQTLHFRFTADQYHLHDLKNIGDDVLSFLIVEEKRDGANEPIPLD